MVKEVSKRATGGSPEIPCWRLAGISVRSNSLSSVSGVLSPFLKRMGSSWSVEGLGGTEPAGLSVLSVKYVSIFCLVQHRQKTNRSLATYRRWRLSAPNTFGLYYNADVPKDRICPCINANKLNSDSEIPYSMNLLEPSLLNGCILVLYLFMHMLCEKGQRHAMSYKQHTRLACDVGDSFDD